MCGGRATWGELSRGAKNEGNGSYLKFPANDTPIWAQPIQIQATHFGKSPITWRSKCESFSSPWAVWGSQMGFALVYRVERKKSS